MQDKNKENKELIEIRANLDALSQEIKANLETKSNHDSNEMMEKMHRMVNSIYSYIDYVSRSVNERMDYCIKSQYEHLQGHLPPIKSAGKLEAALKKLGLEDDYQVIKPALYSFASSKKGLVVEAEYKSNNK